MIYEYFRVKNKPIEHKLFWADSIEPSRQRTRGENVEHGIPETPTSIFAMQGWVLTATYGENQSRVPKVIYFAGKREIYRQGNTFWEMDLSPTAESLVKIHSGSATADGLSMSDAIVLDQMYKRISTIRLNQRYGEAIRPYGPHKVKS